MTLTATTGPPATTAEVAVAWAGRNGAPADLAEQLAAALWWLAGRAHPARADVAFAQAMKETGFLRFGGADPVFSATADMCNPCGLKNADGTATQRFDSWADGALAQMDHLALYAGCPGYPKLVTPDPRHFGFLKGRAPYLESPGFWGQPPDYGPSVRDGYLVPLLGASVTETWMPGATVERGPYDDGAHGGPVDAHDGVVMHVTTNWADPGPFFAQPVNGASSHFWARADGEIVQYLPLEVASWAQAAGNYSYVSVETDGTVDTPLTDAQVLAFAAIYRWVAGLQGIPFVTAELPGELGLGWHGMGGAAWGGHFGCPGDLRKAQRPAVLYLAAGAPAPPPPPPPIGLEVDVQLVKTHAHIDLGPDGNGWAIVDVPFANVVSILMNGADPRVAGYTHVPVPSADDQAGKTQIEVQGGPVNGAVDIFVWSAG